MRKVLVPLGWQVPVDELISALVELGEDIQVTLLHVVSIPMTAPLEVEVEPPEWMVKLAEELKSRGYEVEVKVIEARGVVEGIVEEAEENKYDLILMFRRKRRWFPKIRPGISGRVMSLSKRPVVTVKLRG